MSTGHRPDQPRKSSPPTGGEKQDALWELLGHASTAPVPEGFAREVVRQVEALPASAAEPAGLRGGRLGAEAGLGVAWARLCAGLAGRPSVFRTAAVSFAALVLFAGILAWQLLAPAPQGGIAVQPRKNLQAPAEHLAGQTAREHTAVPEELYAMNSAEVETILQLEDHLAMADAQVWLDDSIALY